MHVVSLSPTLPGRGEKEDKKSGEEEKERTKGQKKKKGREVKRQKVCTACANSSVNLMKIGVLTLV